MLIRSLITVAGGAAILAASSDAGCKSCQANAPASMTPVPVQSAPVHVAPVETYSGPVVGDGYVGQYGMVSNGGVSGDAFDAQHPFRGYRPDHTPYASGGVHNIAPPAGTIGQTYQLPTAPVPAKMHPRTAVLKVAAEGATEVELISTNIMREDDDVKGHRDESTGIWVFKTNPLIPGNQQIYRVRAKYGDGVAHKDRYVRLIMGRVSAISF